MEIHTHSYPRSKKILPSLFLHACILAATDTVDDPIRDGSDDGELDLAGWGERKLLHREVRHPSPTTTV